ncbi:hypothetical protein GV829_13840 [Sphingomonas lacunae]|uniref:Uncharacterized protein n=1 Tax=Sphingomonas lacunae TaxID=2698828 RepID=A0A6M4AWC2_9SPHN|nr:hypothetical protein [Sphingomonas lacunae]QJQ33384.1 hypothetical protein GV829_13840 [Sphingomonas lacunae]
MRMVTKLMLGTALVAALTGCGRRADLTYPSGAPGPAVPTGETRAPTPAELMTPSPQARPMRSDELLKRSEERQTDEFDLPPS